MPYSAAASPSSDNTTAPAKTTTYDALGRVLTVTDEDGGTVTYTYTNNDVLQKLSGTQTFQKQFEYDGLGRLTSVCEISSALTGVGACGQKVPQTGYLTQYTYDALGHLLTVTQNAQAASGSQQQRSFTYDWLGRTLTTSNPETGNNGANGTVTLTYDSISPCADGTNHSYPGNLVQRKDSAGNYTCYSYDALHRVLKEGNGSVTNTILREFVYDSESSYPTGVTVSNGKTRMVEAKTINTSNLNINVTDEFFSYSPRGELAGVYELTPHSSGYYHTSAAYWPTGALETLSGIPGVPTINYGASGAGLDGEGRYTEVTAASGTNPVTSVTYSTSSTTNPLGSLTGVTFGSADSDSFTYDPNTGRMTGYTFSVNSKTDAGTLTWNTNGTVGTLVIADALNASNSQTCTYSYDDLARVAGVASGTPGVKCVNGSTTVWSQTFTYDAFGNVSKSGSSSFAPSYVFSSGATTNQFNSIPGVTVSYDKNGNLLTDNLNTYTWDPNWGNPASVNRTDLIYDALGRMVEQQNGSTDTEILYSPVGKTALMSGQTLTKAFAYLPGGATAIYNSTGLAYYRHSDWLGSSRLTSTAWRTVYSDSAYAPFGEQYAASGTADASYTGQNSDTTSSLYDFTFREHSPSQGRWTVPDPLGTGAVDPTNPQTWNRYAYVNNNPLAFIDPLGLAYTCSYSVLYGYVDGVLVSTDDIWTCTDDGGGGGGGGGGAGGAAAANNGSPQKPTTAHCVGQALAAKGLSIALDVAGSIPGFGNLFSGTVEGIQGLNAGYYGLVTLSSAGNTLLNPSASGAAFTGTSAALTVGSLVFQGSKVIPVIGTAVSLISLGYDSIKAVQAYQQCMAGPG